MLIDHFCRLIEMIVKCNCQEGYDNNYLKRSFQCKCVPNLVRWSGVVWERALKLWI